MGIEMGQGMLYVFLVAWLGVVATGCGGASQQTETTVSAKDEQMIKDWEASAPKDPKPTAESKPVKRSLTGTIDREHLDPVLTQGLGFFLQGVQVKAVFEQKKFIGYQILSFFPNNPQMAQVDIGVGDVVTSVNNMPIERPDQALQVWESLRTAIELRVEYLRGDEVRQLQFSIQD